LNIELSSIHLSHLKVRDFGGVWWQPIPPSNKFDFTIPTFCFVFFTVPASVQQLLRRIDTPSSPSSSSSNSPTSQLQPAIKKPALVIKSTVVPKPVLQTAMPYSLPPPPPYLNEPPPLPPKPNSAKKSEPPPPPLPPFKNGAMERGDFEMKPVVPGIKEPIKYAMSIGDRSSYGDPKISSSNSEQSESDNNNTTNDCRNLNLKGHLDFAFDHSVNGHSHPHHDVDHHQTHNGIYTPSSESSDPTASETNESLGKPDQPPPEEIHTHESPIPERKVWSREKEEERFESKVNPRLWLHQYLYFPYMITSMWLILIILMVRTSHCSFRSGFIHLKHLNSLWSSTSRMLSSPTKSVSTGGCNWNQK